MSSWAYRLNLKTYFWWFWEQIFVPTPWLYPMMSSWARELMSSWAHELMRYRGQEPIDWGIFVCTAIPKAAEEAGRQEAEKKEEADKAKQVWYCWVVNIIIGYCWTCFVFIDITINNEFFALEPVFAHELMSSLVGATFHAWSTLSEQRKLIVLRT